MMVRTDLEAIEGYMKDEGNLFHGGNVEAVFFPTSEEDVIEILCEANNEGKFVTTSGAGTGITGSRVPLFGGIVLSMEKMLHVESAPGMQSIKHRGVAGDIGLLLGDTEAVVPPGMSLQELSGALPVPMMYPPDPTETSALIGSTVATNASGARGFRYGATREWVKGLRVVLANGDVLDLHRGGGRADGSGIIEISSESGRTYSFKIPEYTTPPLKNAAGLYSKPSMDPIDLFIGSEGILGVFTEIRIGLVRPAGDIVSDIAFFDSERNALGYVSELRGLKDDGILSIEYFDENSLDFIRGECPEIDLKARVGVFVEMLSSGLGAMETIMELQEQHAACEDWFARSSSDLRDLREFRHALPEGVNSYLKQHNSYKLGTDFVVPQERFGEMMQSYQEVGESFRKRFKRDGAHYVIFGHIGDCHLHFNFITRNKEELSVAGGLYMDLARKAISLGGTISGEHGVGKKTVNIDGRERPYLELMYGTAGLREIARVKKVFDPNNILNAGNMVPREYLL